MSKIKTRLLHLGLEIITEVPEHMDEYLERDSIRKRIVHHHGDKFVFKI